MKLCECGCGNPTPIIRRTYAKKGRVKGEHSRFLVGHAARLQPGEHGTRWKGGRVTMGGYVYVYLPGHPRANTSGYVREHLLVAERALGRPIPRTSPVHHVDRDGTNNSPTNLVICQDQAYHSLLHQRQRSLDACGDPNARSCVHCGRFDSASALTFTKGRLVYHRACRAEYERNRTKNSTPAQLIVAACLRSPSLGDEPNTEVFRRIAGSDAFEHIGTER